MNADLNKAYDFSGQSIVITGGAGILGGEMAKALVECGANVAILDFNLPAAQKTVEMLSSIEGGGKAIAVQGNVLEKGSIQAAVDLVIAEFGKIDGLINAAGGNKPDATTSPTKSFFDLDESAIRWVFDLNLLGTIVPSQIIGKHMVERGQGVILNVSSMNAFRPLTRIPAYSAAKAGASNFHPMAGGAHGAGILSQNPRQCHRTGLLPDRSESFPDDGTGDRRIDCARQKGAGSHAHGAFRQPGGSKRHGAVAALAGIVLRDRYRGAG